ncbi:MAG: 2Fe-2S iron-sulfur cluster-binding protein [Treponema sp.]
MVVSFKLNGEATVADAFPNERLSSILRQNFGLKTVKISSFDGLKGSDCVLLDETIVASSLIPFFNVENREVVTLEYFSTDKRYLQDYKLIMKCFKENGVSLCGFCDAGKIFAAYKLLKSNLDEEDPNFETKIKQYYSLSLCRCTILKNLLNATRQLILLSAKSKRSINYGRK